MAKMQGGLSSLVPQASTKFERDMVMQLLAGANQAAPYSGSPVVAGITPLVSALVGVTADNRYQRHQSERDRNAFDQLLAAMGQPAQVSAQAPAPSPQRPMGANVDFNLDGKRRPNQPKPELLSMLDQAATEVFGPGARVVVDSGMENPGDQHGSNRHRTGLAADIRVFDPAGNQVKLNDARAQQFMIAAAQRGARGIGAGPEYMGNSFHIDMVPHSEYGPGQGPVWGSMAAGMRDDLLKAMGGGAPQADPSPRGMVTNILQDVAQPQASQRMNPDAVRALIEVMTDPNVSESVRAIAGEMFQGALGQSGGRESTSDQLKVAKQLLDLERAMQPPDRRTVRGADGYLYYQDNGERVLPNVQQNEPAMQPPERKTVRGADGYLYYQDSGERVLPNVQRNELAPNTGEERQARQALQQLEEMVNELILQTGLPDGTEGRRQALEMVSKDPLGRRLMDIAGVTLDGNAAPRPAPSAPSAPSAPAGAPSELPKPTSREEYNSLPSGTRFIDPNGQVRVKP